MRSRWLCGAAVATMLLVFPSAPATAAGVRLMRFPNAATTFKEPLAIRAPDDGSGRVFVVERCGSVRVIRDGKLLQQPFVEVPTYCTDEYGLLGLAFHPDFRNNGVFFVAHTSAPGERGMGEDLDQVLARYVVSPPTNDVARARGTPIGRIPNNRRNHVGGDIHFGHDGLLYWSMGDGGNEDSNHDGMPQCTRRKLADNDPASCGVIPPGNRAPVHYLRGKIIRLDVDARTHRAPANYCLAQAGKAAEYAAPPANPFADVTRFPDDCAEIYDWGLRNPYRFSIDRKTGDLLIADVAAGGNEEVNFQAAGSPGTDFQWPACEGRQRKGSTAACPGAPGSVPPRLETERGAIIGGYVHRGPVVALQGRYVFGDFVSGKLFVVARPEQALAQWTHAPLANVPPMHPYGFGEDSLGNLYVADGPGGKVWRFDSTD